MKNIFSLLALSTVFMSCEITIDSPGKAYASGPVDVANKGAAGCANKEDDDKGDGTGNWMKVALKDIAEKTNKGELIRLLKL